MRLRNKVYIDSKLKEANIHLSRAMECTKDAWHTLINDEESVNMAVALTLPFDTITKTIKKGERNIVSVLAAASMPSIYEDNKPSE